MSRPRDLGRYLVLLLLLALLGIGYDFFHSIKLLGVRISAIVTPEKQPAWWEIRLVLRSDYPEYPFIPATLRRFFRMQPTLCFINADGSELINDDMQGACLLEENEFEKKSKSHQVETSEFVIPINLKPGRINGEQAFLKQLIRQKGVWLRFGLWGYVFPPPVHAAPVFLNLEPFCVANPGQCLGLMK